MYGCSQLEKLPECMGDMESLTELLANEIENEKFLSSIGQLKHVRRLSLRGYSSAPPSSSLISAGVLNWKRWLPISFIMKCLELSNYGLTDRATNRVDFSGLSSLEKLDLSGNKFSSLPSGIGFLPKLWFLSVRACKYLVSIPDLPSSLEVLGADNCKSLERVRIPIKSKKDIYIILAESHSVEEIQGIEGLEGLNNSFWHIYVDDNRIHRRHSPNKLHKSFVEAMCSGSHGYRIDCFPGEMPNWMSYSGEGCSLSFHIPPAFLGLVLWAVHPLEKDYRIYNNTRIIIIIIRNKSNGIQLFKDDGTSGSEGRIRYMSRSEMAMEDYCADDELELYISSQPREHAVHIKECGVHVIAGKSDSLEELEVERDTVMPSPPPYHLLPHPHCCSITASTPKQWSDFLFAKLQGHSLDLTLIGDDKFHKIIL